MLMRHRPVKEVCNALMEWISRAPLEEFNQLEGVCFLNKSAPCAAWLGGMSC
jgi:hypothetical protein